MRKLPCLTGTPEAFCQGHQFGTLWPVAPKHFLDKWSHFPFLVNGCLWVTLWGAAVKTSSLGQLRPGDAMPAGLWPTCCFALILLATEPTRGADNQLFLTAVPARALDPRAFKPQPAQ